MYRFINYFVLLAFISFSLTAMEKQPEIGKKGIKRSASELSEEEMQMPESSPEHVGEAMPPKSIPKDLLDLPDELIQPILEALKYETVKGATETHALYKAAENIRNLFFTNQRFKSFMDDERITGILIRALAQRFNVNIVRAAMALATDTASRWLAHRYNARIQDQAILQLILACEDGQIGTVRFLLNNVTSSPFGHAIINGPPSIISPLIVASIHNHPDIVRYLIAAGADVNKKDKDDMTSLLHAVKSNRSEIVDILIAAHADVDAQNKELTTSLMIAAHAGNLAIMNALLKANADVHIPDAHDRNVLFAAILGQNPGIVARLLEIPDIGINAVDQYGMTPLMIAVKGNIQIVQMLLDAYADINAFDEDEHSVLWHAQQSNTSPDKSDIIALLKGHGAHE